MNLIDTHCHIQSVGQNKGETNTRSLWSKSPDLNSEAIIESAINAGVNKMICIGCDLEDSILATEFVRDFDSCFASIGLHPHEADLFALDQPKLVSFSTLVDRPKVIAIGECGLDYYYNHSTKENQAIILKYQIELAISANLPIIFHVREAYDDFWKILNNYPKIKGVLHSFTDNNENLDRAVEYGLKVGVNGIATFTKDLRQLEMYKSIPLSNLVLETDAPFLTPAPYRGEICQPKFVCQTAEFLAKLRNESLEQLAESTTNNAKELFSL